MVRVPLGMTMKSQDSPSFQVFIMFMDIGEGMMQYIMLYLPAIDVTCHNINTTTHDLIYPGFGGKRAMVSVMHDIHAHTGHPYTHDHCKYQIDPIWQPKG